MRHRFACHIFVAVIMVFSVAPSSGQVQTVYEPSATDPRIVAVLDTQKRFEAAGRRGDWKAIEDTFFAPDLLVHAPVNRVANRDDVMARLRNGQIAYEPDNGEHRVEFIGVRGDTVVVMGEEIVRPTGAAPNAGKVVRRRFTDIWKQYGGLWKLAVRQGTVTSVE
jgi:ketosteroid isomerase-like protein